MRESPPTTQVFFGLFRTVSNEQTKVHHNRNAEKSSENCSWILSVVLRLLCHRSVRPPSSSYHSPFQRSHPHFPMIVHRCAYEFLESIPQAQKLMVVFVMADNKQLKSKERDRGQRCLPDKLNNLEMSSHFSSERIIRLQHLRTLYLGSSVTACDRPASSWRD